MLRYFSPQQVKFNSPYLSVDWFLWLISGENKMWEKRSVASSELDSKKTAALHFEFSFFIYFSVSTPLLPFSTLSWITCPGRSLLPSYGDILGHTWQRERPTWQRTRTCQDSHEMGSRNFPSQALERLALVSRWMASPRETMRNDFPLKLIFNSWFMETAIVNIWFEVTRYARKGNTYQYVH